MQAEGGSHPWTPKSAVVFHREAEKHHTEDVGIRSIMMPREMSTIVTKITMKTIVHLPSIVIMQKRMKITTMRRMRTKKMSTPSLILNMKMMMRKKKTIVTNVMMTTGSIPTEEGLYRVATPTIGAEIIPIAKEAIRTIRPGEMISILTGGAISEGMKTMAPMTLIPMAEEVPITDGAIPILPIGVIPIQGDPARSVVLSRAEILGKVAIPLRIAVQDRVAVPVVAGALPLWTAMK
jgi:hypothetical protein